MSTTDVGSIELIIGPMFCSKTSTIIRYANRFNAIGKSVMAINYFGDNRYGTNNICTHDSVILENCIIIKELMKIHSEYKDQYDKADVIIIEEVQFFKDAFDFITDAAQNDGKTVIVAGLSGTYERKPFGDIYKLIPHAEKITHLHALCQICADGTPAPFTRLKQGEIEEGGIKIGGAEEYEAVCRKHYTLPQSAPSL